MIYIFLILYFLQCHFSEAVCTNETKRLTNYFINRSMKPKIHSAIYLIMNVVAITFISIWYFGFWGCVLVPLYWFDIFDTGLSWILGIKTLRTRFSRTSLSESLLFGGSYFKINGAQNIQKTWKIEYNFFHAISYILVLFAIISPFITKYKCGLKILTLQSIIITVVAWVIGYIIHKIILKKLIKETSGDRYF